MKTMEVIAKENDGKTDDPHRHNFYTVILAQEVSGEHVIDFVSYDFQSPSVFFVAPGQVHQVVTQGVPKGYVFLFTQDFLIKNEISDHVIKDLNLFRSYGESPPLELNGVQLSKLQNIAEWIKKNYESSTPHQYEKIGALMKLFLLECAEACSIPPLEHLHRQGAEQLLRKFKRYVDQEYTQQHKVGFYADQLNVSASHLNKSVKKFTGSSAKEFIQKRITTEAKRLALYSDLSSKEIGFQLGFEDPAHFSAFFKNCTGTNFTEYRAHQVKA